VLQSAPPEVWKSMELDLIPVGTRITKKTNGAAFDISASATRTFLCTLAILEQIEQESVDVSVWGSPDGEIWGTMPLLKMPQSFYRGVVKQALDLARRPEMRFLRARCEVARWGRGAPEAMFVIGFRLTEVSAFTNSVAAHPTQEVHSST
jgi:hypothetical protein